MKSPECGRRLRRRIEGPNRAAYKSGRYTIVPIDRWRATLLLKIPTHDGVIPHLHHCRGYPLGQALLRPGPAVIAGIELGEGHLGGGFHGRKGWKHSLAVAFIGVVLAVLGDAVQNGRNRLDPLPGQLPRITQVLANQALGLFPAQIKAPGGGSCRFGQGFGSVEVNRVLGLDLGARSRLQIVEIQWIAHCDAPLLYCRKLLNDKGIGGMRVI
jgi:hypothetical protein